MRLTLLFDLDGTLTDPKEGFIRCIRYALERTGFSDVDDATLASCIGPPLQESLARLLGKGNEGRVSEAVEFYRERYDREGLYENRPYDGIGPCLEALGVGFTLRVATSKPTVFAARILRHFNLDRHFASIHGSELDGSRSNKGELIRHILDSHALTPNAALMIGDREHDIRGAGVNGVRSIGVLWGYGSEQELHAAGVLTIAAKPQDLPELVTLWARGSGDVKASPGG